MSHADKSVSVLDFEPATGTFLEDVVAGLGAEQKRLPCKYLYDQRGSELFEQICQLQEYYLTRCETAIMEQCAQDMAAQIGPGAMLIEYGSGASVKTRFLLDHLVAPTAYVPVDISRQHLFESTQALAALYEHIELLPVCADFTKLFELPVPERKPRQNTVYFPGSTIGNFQPSQAFDLLRRIAELCRAVVGC